MPRPGSSPYANFTKYLINVLVEEVLLNEEDGEAAVELQKLENRGCDHLDVDGQRIMYGSVLERFSRSGLRVGNGEIGRFIENNRE